MNLVYFMYFPYGKHRCLNWVQTVVDIFYIFPLGRVTEYRRLSLSGAPVPAWIDHMPESGGVGIRGSPAGAHFLQL